MIPFSHYLLKFIMRKNDHSGTFYLPFQSPTVAIVLVNWNQREDLLECVRSLSAANYKHQEIIVVDNASSDGSLEALHDHFSGAVFIANRENLGFARANNLGIEEALRRGAHYVFLLNTDTIVAPDAVNRLIEGMEGDLSIGMATPMIYFYSDPQRIWSVGGKISLVTGLSHHIGSGEIDRGQYVEPFSVDYGVGCGIFLRREAIEKTGLLNSSYFHTFEDTDYSLRMRQMGYRLLAIPRARVWHKISVSTGGSRTPLYLYYFERNRLLFLKRFAKPGSWCLSVPVLLGYQLLNVGSLLWRGQGWRAVKAILEAYRDFFLGRTGQKLEAKKGI